MYEVIKLQDEAEKNDGFVASKTLVATSLLWSHYHSSRYLVERSICNDFSFCEYRDKYLVPENMPAFKRILRLSPESFDFVKSMIEVHPVFKHKGKRRQMSVEVQLKIALMRLGHDGSLTGFDAIAGMMGVSEGSVKEFVDRVINALCSNIELFVSWPNAEEKEIIKAAFLQKNGFPGVVGCLDGTHFELYQAPTFDKDTFYSRKKVFALGATGVVDHRGAFTSFLTGYPSTYHDSTAYKTSRLYNYPSRYFEGFEYLLADAAYGTSETVMTRFKGKEPEAKTPGADAFNVEHASARIIVEHGFGILKMKWRGVRTLRYTIASQSDIGRVSMFISAAVVLHNVVRKCFPCEDLTKETYIRDFYDPQQGDDAAVEHAGLACQGARAINHPVPDQIAQGDHLERLNAIVTVVDEFGALPEGSPKDMPERLRRLYETIQKERGERRRLQVMASVKALER